MAAPGPSCPSNLYNANRPHSARQDPPTSQDQTDVNSESFAVGFEASREDYLQMGLKQTTGTVTDDQLTVS